MKLTLAFLSGLIFGLGLLISEMANPAKVLNFLDLMGTWDPSLAFVMGGAILVAAPGYAILTRCRQRPFFSDAFHIPTQRSIQPRLLVGSALFGIGWGLGGFCPGPALTSMPLAATGTLVFLPTMLLGIYLGHRPPK